MKILNFFKNNFIFLDKDSIIELIEIMNKKVNVMIHYSNHNDIYEIKELRFELAYKKGIYKGDLYTIMKLFELYNSLELYNNIMIFLENKFNEKNQNEFNNCFDYLSKKINTNDYINELLNLFNKNDKRVINKEYYNITQNVIDDVINKYAGNYDNIILHFFILILIDKLKKIIKNLYKEKKQINKDDDDNIKLIVKNHNDLIDSKIDNIQELIKIVKESNVKYKYIFTPNINFINIYNQNHILKIKEFIKNYANKSFFNQSNFYDKFILEFENVFNSNLEIKKEKKAAPKEVENAPEIENINNNEISKENENTKIKLLPPPAPTNEIEISNIEIDSNFDINEIEFDINNYVITTQKLCTCEYCYNQKTYYKIELELGLKLNICETCIKEFINESINID